MKNLKPEDFYKMFLLILTIGLLLGMVVTNI